MNGVVGFPLRMQGGRVVWGVGLSSCGLQVAGSTPVGTRSRDPPYHRGFGKRVIRFILYGCDRAMIANKRGYGRKFAEKLTRPKTPIIITLRMQLISNTIGFVSKLSFFL